MHRMHGILVILKDALGVLRPELFKRRLQDVLRHIVDDLMNVGRVRQTERSEWQAEQK